MSAMVGTYRPGGIVDAVVDEILAAAQAERTAGDFDIR